MYRYRIRAMLIVIFGGLLMVTTRLYYLQIVEGPRYKGYAEGVRLSKRTLPTLRGSVISGDGRVLAADLPAYDIGVRYSRLDPLVEGSRWRTVMLEELKELCRLGRSDKLKSLRNVDIDIEHFGGGCRAIVGLDLVFERTRSRPGIIGKFLAPVRTKITERREGDINLPQQVIRRTKHLADITGEPFDDLANSIITVGTQIVRRRASPTQLVTVVKDVDYELVRTVECRPDLFEGFGARRRTARSYPMGALAAHSIGYMTVASEQDMQKYGECFHGDSAKRLLLGDEVGRSGVEMLYDKYLRGRRGRELAHVDYLRRKQDTIERIEAAPGHDVHLTLDTRWQGAAELALSKAAGFLRRSSTSGALVVIDVQNGDVLAIASHPGYDLQTFSRDYGRLTDPELSPDKPLLNRSVAAPKPPGSIFKIIDACAALNKGVNPNETVVCKGRFRIGGGRCHMHWSIDMPGAIQQSCNIYFWEMALRTGAERVANQARKFGLGSKTGIDVVGERAGLIPSPRQRRRVHDKRWFDGDTMNLAIGQGEVEATPVQVAAMMASIANGGRLYRPHLMKEIVDADGEHVAPDDPGNRHLVRTLDISRGDLDIVRDAMAAVTSEYGGTAYKTFKGFDRFTIAAKTGTAQRYATRPDTGRRYKDNVGWLAGYAPCESPRVAFAVMIEHLSSDQSAGGTAGKVARALFETVPARLMPGRPTADRADVARVTGGTSGD